MGQNPGQKLGQNRFWLLHTYLFILHHFLIFIFNLIKNSKIVPYFVPVIYHCALPSSATMTTWDKVGQKWDRKRDSLKKSRCSKTEHTGGGHCTTSDVRPLHWAYIGVTSRLHWGYIKVTSGLHQGYTGVPVKSKKFNCESTSHPVFL
jgi:hypothetical protein